MTLGAGLNLPGPLLQDGRACLIESPRRAGQCGCAVNSVPRPPVDPGPPGGEGRAWKPSRPPPVPLISGLAKARPWGELAGRLPSAHDSAGPLGVRSLPPRRREGRVCSLGDADATGNRACGGACLLAGGSIRVGRAACEDQVRNRPGGGGAYFWGPREGLGTPGQPRAQWALPLYRPGKEHLWSSGSKHTSSHLCLEPACLTQQMGAPPAPWW